MGTTSLYPVRFQPILKERVWGGRRLQQLYAKQLPSTVPIGESWEISDVIKNGSFAGRDLHWLVETGGSDLLGSAQLLNGRFPLLIKILDATEKLSLQVHPPAACAAALGGEPKTELWYIAEAKPGAELYVGLRHGCSRAEFTRKLKDGTVADCFHRVAVQAGDTMFLPSGRVHALGAGMVIFEIQQNSDTTYRVFDWNRLGLDGKPRDLHVRQSLESIDFDDHEPALVHPQKVPGDGNVKSLVRDELFTVDLAELRPGETLPLSAGQMWIVGVVTGELQAEHLSEQMSLSAGEFCLIPASLERVALKAVRWESCVKRFLQSWLVNTLAVLMAVYLVKGLHYQAPLDLLVASLLLGVINAVFRPFIMFLALPLLVFTLGLFTLIINALVLYFIGNLLHPHFSVDNFWSAFWGALVISIVSVLLNSLTRSGNSRVRFERRRPPPGGGGQGGSGPVIDV